MSEKLKAFLKVPREEILKYEGKWDQYPMEYYPGYQGVGRPPRYDVLHKISYLEEYEKVWGKNWGAMGIGKLREVVLSRPTEAEVHPLFKKYPEYFLFFYGIPDIEKWQEEHDAYAKILKDEGVKIHWVEYPKNPIGPFGPAKWLTFMRDFLVVRGGAIFPRYSAILGSIGMKPLYTMRLLAELGCPILYSVHGDGVWEPGPSVFIAEDVLVTHRSTASNDEGIRQGLPVLERSGVKEVHVMHIPGPLEYCKWPAGGTFHTDMALGVAGTGLIVIYPPLCGYDTIEWLRDRRFKLIEVPPDEYRDYLTVNCVPLEPNKVIMHAGAQTTIKALEKEGVDVIATPFVEGPKAGGGIRCSTLYLIRDRGPGLDEIRR